MEKLAMLLAQGIQPTQAASSVGISDGRLSQLWKAEDGKLKNLVIEKKALLPSSKAQDSLDSQYQDAESKLLKQLVADAPAAEFRELTGALKVVAERNDRHNSKVPKASETTNVQMVCLTLPTHVIQQQEKVISTSSNNEIISVDQNELAPMSSKNVAELFDSLSVPRLEGE